MKEHLHHLFQSQTGTVVKGVIGTSVPVYALTFDVDTWAHFMQAFFGFMVPFLTCVNFTYDIQSKRRKKESEEREERHREYLKDYFRKKRAAKEAKRKRKIVKDFQI